MEHPFGIVGVGRMGGAMWRHLHDLGHVPVVLDTDGAAVAALVADGATAASGGADLAARARTVICSLPRSDDVAEALLGPDGVVPSARPGAAVIDTTSGVPSRSREIAAECERHGVHYVDAGVSGGVHGARSGELNVMAGGSDDAYRAVEPMLRLLGRQVWHCGPAGSGHAMKTVLNLANQAKLLVEIEALLVGRGAGLDPHQMAEVLGLGTWRAFLMDAEGRRTFGFTLGMSCKDYDVGIGVATDGGVPATTLTAAQGVMHGVLDALGPDADLVEYVRVLEREAGVDLPGHDA